MIWISEKSREYKEKWGVDVIKDHTSNLGEQMIKKTVGYRTYDRLLEVCLFVENDLPSYRERKAEERIKRLRGDYVEKRVIKEET